MKQIALIVALLAGIAAGQTTTSITGTIKDLTNANVTSGKITFTLAPSRDTTISGLARFSPQTVTCPINGSGLIKALDGVSTCTITMNTALNPPGSYYVVGIWPYNVKTSTFTFYAVLSSYDWSTVVPTPTTSPAQNFVDIFSNQIIGGNKQFSSPIAILAGGSLAGAYTGNPLFSGNPVFSGTASIKTLNSIAYQFADQYAGNDFCAQVVAAQAALPSTGGTVDARAFSGTLSPCAGGFTLGGGSKPVTLLLGSVWVQVQNTITLMNGSQIIGAGSNIGTAQIPTRLIANGSFPTSTAPIIQADSTNTAFSTAIKDVSLDCAAIAGCYGIDAGKMSEGSKIDNVMVNNYMATSVGGCVNVPSGVGENFLITNMQCYPGPAATGTTAIMADPLSDNITLWNISIGPSTNTQAAGILVSGGANVNIARAHCEKVTDCIKFTGANSGGVVSGVDGLTGVTSLVHIASDTTGAVDVRGLRSYGATNTLKNDIAAFNHVCTDTFLGQYSLSSTASSPQQLIQNCSSLSSVLRLTLFADGPGFKHKRATGCTTGATSGNNCETTVTWTTAFADANYTPVCTLLGTATLGHLAAITTSAIAAASVKVQTVTDTNAAITGTINCIAVHD